MVSRSPRAVMTGTTPKDRCFFPDIPVKTLVTEYCEQLHDMCETLIIRAYNLPMNIWYESEDVKHMVFDGYHAIDHSTKVLKKLMARDVYKYDKLEILDTPCSGCPGPVLLLESYAWTALCILGYMLGMYVGAHEPLTSFISPIFHPICALIMAIALPFFVHARLRKSHWPEDEQRTAAFYASVLFGGLCTYAVGMPSTWFAGSLALFPMWIGSVSGYREFFKPCRMAYLNLTIGLPLAVNVLVAWFFFEHSFIHILAWTVMCVVVGVDLQLKLGRLKRKWASKELEYWETTAIMIATHFLLNHFVSAFTPNRDTAPTRAVSVKK